MPRSQSGEKCVPRKISLALAHRNRRAAPLAREGCVTYALSGQSQSPQPAYLQEYGLRSEFAHGSTGSVECLALWTPNSGKDILRFDALKASYNLLKLFHKAIDVCTTNSNRPSSLEAMKWMSRDIHILGLISQRKRWIYSASQKITAHTQEGIRGRSIIAQ